MVLGGLCLLLCVGCVTFCVTNSAVPPNSDAKVGHKTTTDKKLPTSFLEDSSSPTHENTGDSDSVEWIVKLGSSSISSALWFWASNDDKAGRLAQELGLKNLGQVEPFPDVFRFQGEWSGSRLGAAQVMKRDVEAVELSLSNHESLEWVTREVELVRRKRTNYINLNDPMFSKQWHLVNTKEVGHDINVTHVWQSNITGKGVVVAVVDDGLEHMNNDISRNYNSGGSYDFNDRDADPSPNLKSKGDNTHGTKCAGLIAAVPNNSVCAVGVAHGASVAGIRMLDGKVTDTLEAQSFIYKAHLNWIYSCSWGPEDNGKTVEGPGKLAQEALEMGTSQGRYGYGNVYVFASGNGGQMKDNCNFDGYANSIYTLTVGAIDEKNQMPYYAELCSSMLAVTYSNGHKSGDRTIVTTDASNHGGCTRSFSGTSAAAPIAAGMVALMLQIRNCLTWRDVQSILVYSAVKFDVEAAEWVENGAGFHHSDQHGFGLMDAYRMTSVAGVWPLVPKLLKVQISRGLNSPVSIPSNGSVASVEIAAENLDGNNDASSLLSSLEYIAVTITLSHVRRGALNIMLTSPSGTNCTLSTPRPSDVDDTGLSGWTFTSTRFWGEYPRGVWILSVVDDPKLFPAITRKKSVLRDWTLTLYGSELTPEDVAQRRSLVEKAVNSEAVPVALTCPDLPAVPEDLSLHLRSHSLKLWERIVVFILAVVGGVLMLHLLIEVINNRYKAWKRKRLLNSTSNNVQFNNNGGNGSISADWLDQGEEYSDAEETSNLIRTFRENSDNDNNKMADFSQSMSDRTGYEGNHSFLGDNQRSSGECRQQEDRGKEKGREGVACGRSENEGATGTCRESNSLGRQDSFVEDLVVVNCGNSPDKVGVVLDGGGRLPVDRGREGDGWNSVNLSVDAVKT